MGRDEDKLIRQLSLLSLLLSRPRTFTAREIQESVEGYADMSDDTFARRFHGDRADLAKVGIAVGVLSSSDGGDMDTVQLYYLEPSDYRLQGVDFTAAERKALALALAALDGRFAYARPLRLALTSILRGEQDSMQQQMEQLPVVFAPDEDARLAGRQLSRLEDAVSRGKTVTFSYPDAAGSQQHRTVDPYSLFLIHSHWYLVGHDHLRQALRTFRVGRIRGAVRFPTEKPRDFTIPDDYDPGHYRARPPWLLGQAKDTATIRVGEDLAWWVKRLEPHVAWAGDAEGCAIFSVPYADESLLLSWLTGLGMDSQVLAPPTLCVKARDALLKVMQAHQGEAPAAKLTAQESAATTPRPSNPKSVKAEPIAAEHLARTMSLLSYLLDESRPPVVSWRDLEADLGLTRKEVEEDLSLINLVNFGGGTYALTAEAVDEGVRVQPEMMAEVFVEPARLSPAMARALLLALDVVGESFAVEGLESLSSVRDKVESLIGQDRSPSTVIVDDLVQPDPGVLSVINRAIRDHEVAQIKYFTSTRSELTERCIEPYLLFHSPDGWYLEAYCARACAQRTFKLERIAEARLTGDSFVPRSDLDLARRRTGDVSPTPAESVWATVSFEPRWLTYLEERGTRCRPMHDGRVEAQVPYMDELWIAQEVVRYLGEAVLESPASAREKVRAMAASLLSAYDTVPQEKPPGGEA